MSTQSLSQYIIDCNRMLKSIQLNLPHNPHLEMQDEEYFLLYPQVENPTSPDEIEYLEQIKGRHGE